MLFEKKSEDDGDKVDSHDGDDRSDIQTSGDVEALCDVKNIRHLTR